jgi:hypothetical protein
MESTDATESMDSTNGSEDSTDAESSSDTGDPPPDLPSNPNENIPPLDEEGCPGIYAQDLLPTFELTITPEVWDMLVWQWQNGQWLEDTEQDYHSKFPLAQFVYGDIVITNATIRLRGNPTHWEPDDKMQFEIDFNENDPNGRFLGQRHVVLEAATYNRHMLRDRLAMWIIRDMGIIAPCVNHARVDINGVYYGLFTNIEKIDKSFLERVFPNPTGDLWKRQNWELKTNEMTSNDGRLQALTNADSISELEDYLDVEQALKVFAAEAILPDSDGIWAGGLNYYVYDDPTSGKFVVLPWDMDNTFERFFGSPESQYPTNPDPIVWEKPLSHGRPWFDVPLADDEWFDYYIETFQAQFESSYDPVELHAIIDLWTAQIQPSVFEDTNKPYSNDLYLQRLAALHEYIDTRHAFIEEWLVCWQMGGEPDPMGYCILF